MPFLGIVAVDDKSCSRQSCEARFFAPAFCSDEPPTAPFPVSQPVSLYVPSITHIPIIYVTSVLRSGINGLLTGLAVSLESSALFRNVETDGGYRRR